MICFVNKPHLSKSFPLLPSSSHSTTNRGPSQFFNPPTQMASALSNVLQCPSSQISRSNSSLKSSGSNSFFSVVRFKKTSLLDRKLRVTCAAASAAGNSSSDSEFNPYQVLGVNPIEGFDAIKTAYSRRRKDAERRGDEETVSQLEKAYDKIMMAQLTNRKKGVTFGSLKVSKDIKYADKMPALPWGPRFTKSDVKDTRINMAIAAVFSAWIFIKRNAEWKPLQFLAFVFVYRIFEKLKAFEPPTTTSFSEEGEVEDEGRGLRMGKRLLRSLALVFGCIAFTSLGFTGLLNLLEYAAGFIPVFLYNNQELFVTASTALSLYILATYYR